MRLLAILLFLAACGGLGYLLIATPRQEWDLIPVGGGVSLITASLAGLVALAATETFNVRRQREIEGALRSRREEVYERLLRHMTASFKGGNPDSSEVEIRAAVAVWASAELIDSLAEWNTTTARIMRQHQGNVPPGDKFWLQEALGKIAILARKDLTLHVPDSNDVSAAQVSNMVFNDYQSSRRAAIAQEHE